jgi:hypothetical protein
MPGKPIGLHSVAYHAATVATPERGQSMFHLHETHTSTPPRYPHLTRSSPQVSARIDRYAVRPAKGATGASGKTNAADVLHRLCIVIRRACPNIFGAMLERANAQARTPGLVLSPSVMAGTKACRGHSRTAASAGRNRAFTSYTVLLTSKDRVHVFT